MKICHLVGAGDFEKTFFNPAADDFVIACDAGLKNLEAIGCAPDLIVGDFDSYGSTPESSAETVVLPCEKDDTDISFAAREGFARGFRRFYLHGVLGGARPSHSLANLGTAAQLVDLGAQAFLFAKNAVVFLAGKSSFTVPRFEGYLSLFAYAGPCSFSVSGVKYPFDGRLVYTAPLGVSNEVREKAFVNVRKGKLLVVLEGAGLSEELLPQNE